MEYLRVDSIIPFKENNPFLLSWLQGGKEVSLLFLKKRGIQTRIYFLEDNKELLDKSGWKYSEKTGFDRKGKRIFLRGDSRLLRFGNENYADRVVELLNEEESGFLKIRIVPSYFKGYKKNEEPAKSQDGWRKQKERRGWKIIAEFSNSNLGDYLSHIFAAPGVRIVKGRMGFNYPILAWWEVYRFIPSRTYSFDKEGVKIGTTGSRGDVFLDVHKNTHALISGSSGAGKSTMIVGIMNHILKNRLGTVILIDPHGDTAKKMEEYDMEKFVISPDSMNSVNVIKNSTLSGLTYRIAEDFVSILKSSRETQYSDPLVGPRMEDLISRGISLLAKINGITLVDFYNVLKDDRSRREIYDSSEDIELKSFLAEVGEMNREEKASTERAIGRLVNDPIIRSLICNPEDDGILARAISNNDLIIFDLERSSIGYEDSKLLSNIFALYSWFDISSTRKGEYFLFLEEGQDYQSDFIADMLSSGRKYGLHVFFVTTSFKSISENMGPLLFSNVSAYIFMKLADPDKIKVREFLGRDLDFPNDPLDFLVINTSGEERGRVDPVKFPSNTKEFRTRNFDFITQSNRSSLVKEIDSIISNLEKCKSVFFLYEEFVRVLSGYNKSEIISILKNRVNNNPNIHYAGRISITSGAFKGRHECFQMIGGGENDFSLPQEFRITSDLISHQLGRN